MIERIAIKNFQAHEALKVKLSPRLTCFVGPSDSGKSSIIRALRWLCSNKPRGDAFMRGDGVCSVVGLVDGRKVGRRRSASLNEYALDGEKFKAFGAEVPEAIQDVLQVEDGLNFQSQHDAPYWVGLSPPEVARQLNAIVDLGVIDDVAKQLAARLRKEKTRESLLEEQIADSKAKLAQYEEVDRLNDIYMSYEEQAAKAESKEQDVYDLSMLLRDIRESVAVLKGRKEMQAAMDEATAKTKTAVALEDEHQSLLQAGDKLRRLEAAASEEPPSLDQALIERVEEAESACASFKALLRRIREASESLRSCREAEAEADKVMSSMPEVCQECGRPLRD